jgi:hypothetical protein
MSLNANINRCKSRWARVTDEDAVQLIRLGARDYEMCYSLDCLQPDLLPRIVARDNNV